MTPHSNVLKSTTSREAIELNEPSPEPLHLRMAVARKVTQGRHANVLGIGVEAITMAAALERIEDALVARRKGYVCFAGVHGIMEAQRSSTVKSAFSNSFLTLPDGTPTVWVGKWQGMRQMQRVTGPDLMLEIFRSKRFARYSHFFYGGKPGVAQELASKMSQQFPWIRIVGTYTPPFHDLTSAQQQHLVSTIRTLKPAIVWVGISTPRQEMFMHKYLSELDTCLMFGVGAAFDFHTGRIKDCAEWIKRAGFQWFHRLIQDPRHLLWRYARNNPEFIWKIVLQLSGVRVYKSSGHPVALPENVHSLQETNPDLCTGENCA